ncbi:Trehalose-phosphatase, partial [Globisporangium splendens]
MSLPSKGPSCLHKRRERREELRKAAGSHSHSTRRPRFHIRAAYGVAEEAHPRSAAVAVKATRCSCTRRTRSAILTPSANWSPVRTIAACTCKQPVVFLDYDGTLSPIVDIPDRAFMTDAMRDALHALSSKFITAIVTGRSTEKVYNFVQLDNLVYAGSHGFDIKGTKSLPISCQVGDHFRPALEDCIRDLSVNLAEIPGAEIEDNRLAVSVHYRHVAPALQSVVERIVDDYVAHHPSLVKKHGKKVFELRPQVDWNKGRAVLFILSQLGLDAENVVPFYLGDDVSDEDAFNALNARGNGKGVSIIVRDPEASKVDLPGDTNELPATTAAYSLRDTLEVEQFLNVLATLGEVATPVS